MTIDIYNPYTIRIIGGLVVGILLILIRFIAKHIQNRLTSLKKSKKQKPAKEQKPLAKDAAFDKHTTPTNIIKKLSKTPPLQRNNIAQHYKGISVSWKVNFRGIETDKNNNTEKPMFSYSSWIYVSCDINPNDYPKLKITNEKQPIIVQGVIESVDYDNKLITLNMCKLKF